MITWMQRNRKVVVVMLWLSGISFIGAGAVGWGSYDFGKSGGSIAKVGEYEITQKELQSEYNKYYNYYAQIFQGQMTQEMAKNFKLQSQAYQSLINQYLLVNFADELGMVVTDEAVANEIMKIPSFQKDGAFDKALYTKVLQENGIGIKGFERDVKRGLLVQKVQAVLDLKLSPSESEALAFSDRLSDRVSIDIINKSAVKLDMSEQALKDYWNINKAKYKTITKYELLTQEVPMVKADFSQSELESYHKEHVVDYDNKKLHEVKEQVIADLQTKRTKKEANKLFYKVKNGEATNLKALNIDQNSLLYGDILQAVSSATDGDTLKPIKQENGFVVVQIKKIDRPRTMTFEEAQPEVTRDYRAEMTGKELEKLAQSRLAMVAGVDQGYITPTSTKLPSLDEYASKEMINYIFSQKSATGYKVIGDRAILYKITDQKVGSSANLLPKSNISQLKSDIVNSSLIKQLKTKYAVESYYEIEG
jgi:peptidyl-prolyl cis-trans isomerase D